MPKLYQHQLDDTYYTRLYWPNVNAIVTRQIHPDGVVFLKRQGVQLEGEIPAWLIDELDERNWLATKEEMPFWGIVDWPKWHLIDAPMPKPFSKENPFRAKKREAERAAKLAAEEEERRSAEAAERQKLEEKRAANRERGRCYRAKRKAEADAARVEAEEAERKTEAKREARRERDRRYRARKKAEAEAAREAVSAVAPPRDPHDDADTPSESLPANLAVAPSIGGERRESARTPNDSLTQLAPRHKLIQSERLGTPIAAAQQAERRTLRLFALLVVGFILLMMAIGQILDILPM